MTTKAKPRILIVDDEPVFLRTLSELCTGMGCEVTTAADGKQALDILAKEQFVLVISDIRMPKMNGVSLLECIESRGVDVPVIMMSGFSDYTDEDIDDRNGVMLLEKPFSIQQLREIIENFIPLLPSKAA